MRCFVLGLIVVASACTDPLTTEGRQALESDSCRLLPEPQDFAGWTGTPLFPATTRRAVTLVHDRSEGRWAAYGVDVDAGAVTYVMVGTGPVRALFLSQLVSIAHEFDAVSTIAGKVGGGNPDPRPPGDPGSLSPSYLTAMATAVADAASRDPIACE